MFFSNLMFTDTLAQIVEVSLAPDNGGLVPPSQGYDLFVNRSMEGLDPVPESAAEGED